MDTFRINKTEMKITLSSKETERFELGAKDSDTKSVIRTILQEAGEKIIGEKILVKMFQSRDGGCELFITKISSEKTEYQTKYGTANEIYIYSFEKFSNLLCTCRFLFESGYSESSSAYIDRNGRGYYLILEINSPIIPEMGGRLMKKTTMYYIMEYCRMICDCAVSMYYRFG